jgi:alpha-L-arabinofuranosidase
MQKQWFMFFGSRLWLRVLAAVLLFPLASCADQIIYDDALENGWQNWGYAEINYANPAPVYTGSDSISVTITNAWEGIQIWHPDQDSTPYGSINFWLNGGPNGGQHLQVYGLLDANGSQNSSDGPRFTLPPLPVNSWQLYSVPLSKL